MNPLRLDHQSFAASSPLAPQEGAHAGRTKKNGRSKRPFWV
jgi:hypothetical protein